MRQKRDKWTVGSVIERSQWILRSCYIVVAVILYELANYAGAVLSNSSIQLHHQLAVGVMVCSVGIDQEIIHNHLDLYLLFFEWMTELGSSCSLLGDSVQEVEHIFGGKSGGLSRVSGWMLRSSTKCAAHRTGRRRGNWNLITDGNVKSITLEPEHHGIFSLFPSTYLNHLPVFLWGRLSVSPLLSLCVYACECSLAVQCIFSVVVDGRIGNSDRVIRRRVKFQPAR